MSHAQRTVLFAACLWSCGPSGPPHAHVESTSDGSERGPTTEKDDNSSGVDASTTGSARDCADATYCFERHDAPDFDPQNSGRGDLDGDGALELLVTERTMGAAIVQWDDALALHHAPEVDCQDLAELFPVRTAPEASQWLATLEGGSVSGCGLDGDTIVHEQEPMLPPKELIDGLYVRGALDVEGDAVVEIVAMGIHEDTVGYLVPWIFRRAEDGWEYERVLLEITWFADNNSAVAGDLDGDGLDELVLTHEGMPPYFDAPEIVVLNPRADYAELWRGPQVVDALGLSLEDLDGDGMTDLLVAAYDGFAIAWGTGDAQFETPASVDLAWLAPAPDVLGVHGAHGDFDGDRRKELLGVLERADGTRTLAIVEDPFGTPALHLIEVVDYLGDRAVFDVDRDGRDDIVFDAMDEDETKHLALLKSVPVH